MFSITTKVNYGISASIELADSYGRNLVQIKDIVARRMIPRNYLEQILNQLSKAGVVKSVRGIRGGYELADHPDNIPVLRIFEALDGEVRLAETADSVALRSILLAAEETMKAALGLPLSRLAQMQKSMTEQVVYNI